MTDEMVLLGAALVAAMMFTRRRPAASKRAPTPAPAEDFQDVDPLAAARAALVASDPALRLLAGLVDPAPLPVALTETASAREVPARATEAQDLLRQVLARARDEQVGVVALETVVKTVNAAKAESWDVLATVYLRRANVARRIGVRLVRGPAGAVHVVSLAPSESADDPGASPLPADAPADRPLAEFTPAAVYSPM
jgi:hypothetical protein